MFNINRLNTGAHFGAALVLSCTVFSAKGLIGADIASARPISYPGGWTILQTKDGDSASLGATYTVTKDYSLGYKAEYFDDKEWALHTATLDYLLLKKNLPGSQANLYLKNGVGIAHSDYERYDNKNELAGYTGLAADWEDRRYMIKYENRAYYAGDIAKQFRQNVMAGIAPYIGGYGDLHTWLMMDFAHTPGMENNYTITPNVMFFKGDTLFEVGVSNHMDLMLNTVFRF